MPNHLSLAEAEELLLQRNLAIAGSRQQIEVTEALRKIVGLKPNPTLQFGAEQIPFVSPIAGSVPRLFATNPDTGANPVYTAQLGRLIERGGKRELRVQQAEALVDVAKAQLTDTFRQQLLQLRQAFTNALLAKENLNLAEEIDRRYRDTERLMETRLRVGDIAKVDLQRVQMARLPYQQAVIDARSAYWQAARDVATILSAPGAAPSSVELRRVAVPVGPTLELTGELSVPPDPPALEELRAIALRERPDFYAAQSNVRAAERGTRLAEAQKVRDIYTAVEYQRVGNDHSIGATVSFPLFLYNNQRAGISQAVAQERLNNHNKWSNKFSRMLTRHTN